MSEWIPVTYREPTKEERESECYDCGEFIFLYDCKLPKDGQEVLVTTNRGYVACTTFYEDCGCYFENYEDEGEIVAWMPFPLPYAKK